MITISLIGVATVLLVCAILAKAFADEPKASKSQRTEIVARLLALSEAEQKLAKPASSVRLKAPVATRASRASYLPSGGSNNIKLDVIKLDVGKKASEMPPSTSDLRLTTRH